MTSSVVLAISGASGAVYAVRLLDVLLAAGETVHLAISPAGQAVIRQELELDVDLERFELASLLPDAAAYATGPRFARLRGWLGPDALHSARAAREGRPLGTVRYHHHRDLLAPIASGSSLTRGMVICPCSGGTVSAIATAASGNLIHRAADVHLKERRKLILVPRETPLSTIQLDNLHRCAAAGAIVLPAMPGWYHGVESLRDLVDFVVARVLDHLGVEHRLMRRWGEGDAGGGGARREGGA